MRLVKVLPVIALLAPAAPAFAQEASDGGAPSGQQNSQVPEVDDLTREPSQDQGGTTQAQGEDAQPTQGQDSATETNPSQAQSGQQPEDPQGQNETAQDSSAQGSQEQASDEAPQEQEALRVFFETGQAALGSQQAEVLDQAARLFREGNPYVMILSGGADTTGPAEVNLDLSLSRARAVAEGLEDRGIPVDRLQVTGLGTTELPVETGPGVSESENRVVEITWR